ncbi:hypothetical protein [Parasphingorhabdus sp.]|uniref:hypothetical protein n=1 Tax=Parasphingorhabdus sp. TaxID=2709688 RepID=UPI003001606A
MRNLSRLYAATLTTLALAASPVMAQQAQPDQTNDQAALNQFIAAVETIRSNLPSAPDDVAKAGSECYAAINALVQALPATISSSIRCDAGDTGGIVIIGGAALR